MINADESLALGLIHHRLIEDYSNVLSFSEEWFWNDGCSKKNYWRVFFWYLIWLNGDSRCVSWWWKSYQYNIIYIYIYVGVWYMIYAYIVTIMKYPLSRKNKKKVPVGWSRVSSRGCSVKGQANGRAGCWLNFYRYDSMVGHHSFGGPAKDAKDCEPHFFAHPGTSFRWISGATNQTCEVFSTDTLVTAEMAGGTLLKT